jgi:hypothetical protein
MPLKARGRPATAALDVRPAPTDTNKASITPAAITGLLELGDERDLHLRRLLAAGREAFDCGRALGSYEGYAQAEKDMAPRWEEIALPVVRGLPLAEIGRWRWDYDGREHFADRRPGDYTPPEAA